MEIEPRHTDWKPDDVFRSGADLIGRDIDTVVERLGPYSFYGSLDHGHEVAQWRAERCRIEVWFAGGWCEEIVIRK